MSTESTDHRPGDPGRVLPAAPTAPELAAVPGVLGEIARERHHDYAAVTVPTDLPRAPQRRPFAAALAGPRLAIIAEIKRSSPSQGRIADLDPVVVAGAYRDAGAAALSVLTEPRHFGGGLEHLAAVAAAVELPLLRKDFVVHPAQVVEARLAGASAVLLIAAVLGERLRAYRAFAEALGLEALVEVHDAAELALALRAGTNLLGVNNRDLTTLQVDLAVAPRLLRQARAAGFRGVTVAESGYSERRDLESLVGVADAVLIGTSLAASADPGAALAALA